jgi:predicted Zn-dependent protease
VPASPAVAALVRDAEGSRGRGDLDKAASSLERAIRIQPRNPELWTRMAQLRLEQNQPTVAENLAKRSNVLAKGNRSLIQRNWALIAQARRSAGDSSGAAEAEARAGQ